MEVLVQFWEFGHQFRRCRTQLAGSDHHVLALLVEGHLDGLGSGGLRLGLVGVGADLVVNLLSTARHP